ncbi:hypothetical protein LIR34_11320 [Blautia sp. MSK17_66]|uniref:hypothetical protein n=1 Tax=Blautia TaxID=572511 RepID=UPI00156FE30F|nr:MULTISPECIES: hypothetical protein [Blautia]MCB5550399.1 hypothetical protein [Blautia sp. MSK17_66]NSK01943.1 hypothetical protein [Blautia obeum]
MPDPTSFLLYIGWHFTNQQKKKELILCDFLLFPHIRQRGDVGGSAKKVGLRIKELKRIYGIEKGNNQYSSLPNNSASSQSDLATLMGISVDTLQNYKLLAEMIPELEELVDTGIVTKTTESEFSMILFLDIFQFLHIGVKLIDTFLSCCLIVAPFLASIQFIGDYDD